MHPWSYFKHKHVQVTRKLTSEELLECSKLQLKPQSVVYTNPFACTFNNNGLFQLEAPTDFPFLNLKPKPRQTSLISADTSGSNCLDFLCCLGVFGAAKIMSIQSSNFQISLRIG